MGIKCLKCNETLIPDEKGTFISCKCGNAHIDGTEYYIKYGVKDINMVVNAETGEKLSFSDLIPPKKPLKEKCKVFFLGDSVTYGVGDTKEGGYVSRIQKYFRENKGEYEYYDIYNLGINANTSCDLANRAFNELNARSKDDLRVDRVVCIVYIGGNDISHDVCLNTFQLNLQSAIFDIFRAYFDCDVYFVGIHQMGEKYTHGKTVEEYNEVIKTVCKKFNLNYIPNPILLEDLSEDELHPNPKGYEKLTKVLLEYIK